MRIAEGIRKIKTSLINKKCLTFLVGLSYCGDFLLIKREKVFKGSIFLKDHKGYKPFLASIKNVTERAARALQIVR